MIDRAEVLRYLGAPSDEGIGDVIDKAISLAETLSPKHLLTEYQIANFTTDGVILENGLSLSGQLAVNSLQNCKKVIILIATLTLEADRIIRTAGSMMAQAAVNAAMSAAIEGYVDALNDNLAADFRKKNQYLTKRFSPGYGDLPLSLQKDIIKITNADKLLGVTVTENLLLVPVKTVTAIIGVSDTPHDKDKHKCGDCKKNCIYRR